MNINALILVASVLAFTASFAGAIKEVAKWLAMRTNKRHVLEIEIDGETINIDPSSVSQSNTAAIDRAILRLNKADHAT